MKGKKFVQGAVFFLALGLLAGSAFAEMGALDGKTFTGQMGEKGKEEGMKDDFVFKEGKFRSTACDLYGFSDAVYTTTGDGNTVAFHAVTTSATDGATMEWNGVARGNKIEGTAAWRKPGAAEAAERWFKGELQ